MNKYLNIILVSFFSVLTVYYKIGLVLYIPIVTFFILYNNKNLYLILPSSLVALILFDRSAIILYLIFMASLIIYIFISKRYNSLLLTLIYIFAMSLFSITYFNDKIGLNETIIYLLFSLISVMIYFYFVYNVEGVLNNQNNYRNFAYVEVVMAIIAVIGASNYEYYGVNLGLAFAIFFGMYLSSNDSHAHSLFFGVITLAILKYFFQIEEGIVIPFVCSFYIFPKLYGPIILMIFCMLGIIIEVEFFSRRTLEACMAICIFFEINRFMLVGYNTKETIIKGVYNKTIENINNEIIGFASFLDFFSKEFSTPKEYSQKLSEGINNLTHYYCEGCYVKNECYSRNRGKLYTFFKNMILYAKRKDVESSSDENQFIKGCPYIVEMRKSSVLINEKLNLNAASSKLNSLVAELNGISNVLRQYTVDKSIKMELDYDIFYLIKKGLTDYGFNVCYFEPKKILTQDFLIELGIRGYNFKDIQKTIEEITNNYIDNKCSVLFVKAEKGKTYVKIVPKINYEIDYGYGSIAQDGNNICGDNYLIKHLTSSKLVAAISDGMGKGYAANQESNNTLRLVDNITNIDMSTETSLQILNTFYFIQDYLEKYSTLDFLEINRSTGEGTFYKMGASSSYIFHKEGNYKKIENENLPFGLEEIIETKKVNLKDNDLIVMASDGVFENIENEKDLEVFIKGIIHLEPQKITYELLNYVRRNKVKTNDDMSVIALKVYAN